MPGADDRRRKRRTLYGALATAVVVIGAGAATYWAADKRGSVWPPAQNLTTLEIRSTRDIGSLPSRDSWCTLVRSAEHCWLLQESSGNAIDSGATGGWDLVPAGSPRRGVVSGVPVASPGAVDFTSEKAVFTDAANDWLSNASTTLDSTEKHSVTIIYRPTPNVANNIWVYRQTDLTDGIAIYENGPTARLYTVLYYGGSTASQYVTRPQQGAWSCVTIAIDRSGATASKVYINGATAGTMDFSGAGDFSGSTLILYALGNTLGGLGGGARLRADHNTALTLADHQTLCGSLWQPPEGGTTRIAAGDASWTQTGGARCYPASASTAVCVPGGLVPYSYDASASAIGVPVEPTATNRVTYSTAIDCTNWTCATSTIAAAVAPDGSKTAGSITHSGGTVDTPAASGYTNSTALALRLWVKCSSGTLSIVHQGGTGDWDVACATVAGSWALLTTSHAAVTENTAYQSTAGGALTLRFSGADATVWAPTATEEPGTGVSVIPTAASAVSTGDIAWAVDNSTGKYYRTGSGVTQTLTTVSGTCWVVDGTTLRLTGATGSECAGFWHLLEVRR